MYPNNVSRLRPFWDDHSHSIGSHESEFLVPFLIDAACGIAGYRDGIVDSIMRAPEAILKLLQDQGIGLVWVPAATWAEAWRWQAVSRDATTAPKVLCGGPVLVDRAPSSDRERWIRGSSDLSSALGVITQENGGWAIVQTADASFAQLVGDAARARGLRLAFRGPVSCADVLVAGDLFCGFANLGRTASLQSAMDVLESWGRSPSQGITDAGRAMMDRGVMISTELIAFNRTVFVKDSLQTPFLELNEPILPHVKWLLQMRRVGGFAAGKSALSSYAGLREPSRTQYPILRKGWERLVDIAVTLFSEFEGLRPGSGAPQLAVLPGRGLREELILLHTSGVPLLELLQRATGRTAWGEVPETQWLSTSKSPADGSGFIASLRPHGQGLSE